MYHKKSDHNKPCMDHLGNHFSGIKSMCNVWNIEPGIFCYSATKTAVGCNFGREMVLL